MAGEFPRGRIKVNPKKSEVMANSKASARYAKYGGNLITCAEHWLSPGYVKRNLKDK